MSKRSRECSDVYDAMQTDPMWPQLLEWIAEDAELWNISLQNFLRDVLLAYFSWKQ